MKEIGIVESVNGNNAKVVILRSAACGDCGACQVGKEKLTMETNAINLVKAEAGDRVEVEMAFKNVMKASLIAYGLPLLMFIVGSLIGAAYTGRVLQQPENPLFSFGLGLILLVLSYAGLRILEKKGKFSSSTYQPRIINILKD